MVKFLSDGPLYLRIPAYFILGTLATAIVLTLVIAVIAFAISLGWWGFLFIFALIGGLVVTCTALTAIEHEKLEKEAREKRQQRL
mgnify:CR=1 FL=1